MSEAADIGRYVITVPHWHPVTINQLLGMHWGKRAKRKRSDLALIAHYSRSVPKATGKRRVTLEINLKPRQRAADPDSQFKSVCDSLVHLGILVNDDRFHVELGPSKYQRGTATGWGTRIVIEEIPSFPEIN